MKLRFKPYNCAALATVPLLILGGLSQATAQPSITKQPTSIAVALGEAATLQVTASAPTPLTFQWQFNGADLAGAVSNRLTVQRVSSRIWALHRGRARWLNEPARASPPGSSWRGGPRWSSSVTASAWPQYSNGRSWVEWLGELLCLSASNQVRNYAMGGAGTAWMSARRSANIWAPTPQAATRCWPRGLRE